MARTSASAPRTCGTTTKRTQDLRDDDEAVQRAAMGMACKRSMDWRGMLRPGATDTLERLMMAKIDTMLNSLAAQPILEQVPQLRKIQAIMPCFDNMAALVVFS